MGGLGSEARKPPMVATFAARREGLIRCFPGSLKARDDIFPANLRKATIDPVKVIPPNLGLSEVAEWYPGSLTNHDTEVRSHSMQCREMRRILKDASNTRQDRGQSDDRVEEGNSLRKFCRCNTPSDEETEETTNCCYASELSNNLRLKANGA